MRFSSHAPPQNAPDDEKYEQQQSDENQRGDDVDVNVVGHSRRQMHVGRTHVFVAKENHRFHGVNGVGNSVAAQAEHVEMLGGLCEAVIGNNPSDFLGDFRRGCCQSRDESKINKQGYNRPKIFQEKCRNIIIEKMAKAFFDNQHLI